MYRQSQRTRPARDKQKGTTTVELAVVLSVFLAILFTIFDFAIFGYVNLTMQHAVREGSRYAVTGRSDLDPQSTGDRKAAVVQKIRDSSMGLFDRVSSEADIIVTDPAGNPVTGFGAPGDIVVIRMNCAWPPLSPFSAVALGGDYQFQVGSTMRNEFFPPPPPPQGAGA